MALQGDSTLLECCPSPQPQRSTDGGGMAQKQGFPWFSWSHNAGDTAWLCLFCLAHAHPLAVVLRHAPLPSSPGAESFGLFSCMINGEEQEQTHRAVFR